MLSSIKIRIIKITVKKKGLTYPLERILWRNIQGKKNMRRRTPPLFSEM